MELKNIRTIHSSEKSEIVLGEFDGKQYIKKTGGFSCEAVEKIAEIDSPYIARIVEIGEDHVITEYADGGDLSKMKLPPGQVFEIALELCNVLRSLHERNVIHRDIKPSNIIFCNNEHIKLIDFGAARVKKPVSDKDTRIIGTDGFAPPEQFGFSQTDERSDIYAFGVTIKLLLGKSYDSSPYKRVIERCMRFNPDERYSSVKAVKAALIMNRILPFALFAVIGAVVTAALIIILNYYINTGIPDIEEYSDIESISGTSELNLSEASSFSSISSSTSGLSSLSSSSSSSGLSSSSSSNLSSSSLSSSSSGSSSLSSSSSSSSSSGSSSSSRPIIQPEPFPYENERSYTVNWNLLSLPNGFPRLADRVTSYTLVDSDNGNNRKFTLTWNVMPYNEAEQIANKIYAWMGNGTRKSFNENEPGKFRWEFTNAEYRITVNYGINENKYITRIEGSPRSKKFDPQLKVLSPASGINKTESRNVSWESTNIDKDFPKLADYVFSYEEFDGEKVFNWDDMTIAETECIVQKIVDSFQGEYWLHYELREREFAWRLRGEIGGEIQRYIGVIKSTQ